MTPSTKSSTDQATELLDQSVKLVIRGRHIPSFKNAKRIVGEKLITDPEIKARKKAIEEDFVWQLLSDIRIGVLATQMGLSRRSLIALLLPEDDCWTVIPEITIKCELVEDGEEGCEVVIQKIG
jgi:hypothetical protein